MANNLDPRTKTYLRDHLMGFVYNPVLKILEKRLHVLIERNCKLGKLSHKSFVHRGVLYNCDAFEPPRLSNRLIPQLVDDFESWCRDNREIVAVEIPYTQGYLTHVLNSSNSMTDYLKLLPDVMHSAAMEYQSLCNAPPKLTDEDIALICKAHQNSISLLKQRMVRNLLM